MATPFPSEKREILACAEQGVVARRQAEVDDLRLLLAWADAHSGDPQAEPGVVPVRYGGPKLVTIGGDGTPGVNDLCFAELAIARQTGMIATQNATADALDLRHRLPGFWACVQDLACEVWVARKVATMSRQLSKDAAAHVDTAVTAVVTASAYRIIAVAEAAIVEADPAAHRDRIESNQNKRGVWLSQPRPGDSVDEIDPTAGVRTLTGRLDEADALEFYQAVEDLTDALEAHGDHDHDPDNPPTRDQLRADAMALLGRPEDALALLTGEAPATGEDVAAEPDDTDPAPARPRGKATLYAHFSASDLTHHNPDAVADVETLGPMLVDQLARLLKRRDIELQPVIDLHHIHTTNSYRHPDAVKRRTELRTGGDVFPHATHRSGVRLDHDHPVPYDKHGPPGQTGDHNDAPLTRRHHRAKTHTGIRCHQLGLGTYRWATPHGLVRIVTPSGTRKVQPLTPDDTVIGEIYDPPPGITVILGPPSTEH